MTVSTTASRKSYNGNGATVNFSFPYKFLDDGDLVVVLVESDGTETTQTITTDYTVTGAGNDNGGTVTMNIAPASGERLVIYRNMAFTQEVDYISGDAFPAETHEGALDRLTLISQQLQDAVDRSAKLPETSTADADSLVADLILLADIADDISDVAAIDSNVTTVAGIDSDVTTVAGIAGNVTTVAGISANVTSVAGNASNINTVAANISDVSAVAAIDSDVSAVAAIDSDVSTVAADGTDIGTVAGISANVTTVAGIAANVTTVAGISANVTSVAGNATNINTVAGIDSDVSTVAGIAADVTAVANNEVDVSQVAADIAKVIEVANDLQETVSEIDTVANNIADVNTVGTAIADVSAVAAIDSDVTTVSGISANVTTVAGVSANVTTVAGISANVTTVAGISANVTTVAGDSADIATVAGISADVSAVAAIDSDITTAAANVADITNFADVYIGASATAPTTRADSSALQVGDLYFDTSTDTMKVYSSGGWTAAGSSVNGTANRYDYVVGTSSGSYTGSTTNFPATYDAGYVDVFLNGTKLVPTTDFTATSGTEIVLGTAASSGSNVCIVGYGTFSLVNFSVGDANDVDLSGISDGDALLYNSTSGNFEAGPVDALPSQSGNSGKYLTTDGSTASWGTVTTPTLASLGIDNHDDITVDGSGNVGIGTSSPKSLLDLGNGSGGVTATPSASYSDYAIALYASTTTDQIRNFVGVGEGSAVAAGIGFYDHGTGGKQGIIFNTGNLTATAEAMRIDSLGNLSFNSGYGSSAVAYGCRAWAKIDSGASVQGSGGFSSVTYLSAGEYQFSFSSAMPDSNYSILLTNRYIGSSYVVTSVMVAGESTTSFSTYTRDDNSVASPPYTYCAVIR